MTVSILALSSKGTEFARRKNVRKIGDPKCLSKIRFNFLNLLSQRQKIGNKGFLEELLVG